MAFKSIQEFTDETYKNRFTLANDGDSADVIFLYKTQKDIMIADPVHYIKNFDYNGYVHCNGKGCEVCKKGVRVQGRLFIPLYDIESDTIKYWDRSVYFATQIQKDVFGKYPNPSEIVFEIIRHGEARDMSTWYEIRAKGRNKSMPMDDILKKNNLTMMDFYDNICTEFSNDELFDMLNVNNVQQSSGNSMSEYGAIARPSARKPREVADLPDIDLKEYSGESSDDPPFSMEEDTDIGDDDGDGDGEIKF